MQNTIIDKIDLITPSFSKSILFHNAEDKQSPIQLIAHDNTKGYYITQEAENFFNEIKASKLGIVSIIGKSRTGKSYLLNRLLLNKTNGFQVGHSINPCTKGIWIWPSQIEIINNNNINEKIKVIVMDTEGIGATDQDENHDSRIFLLALLLSSYFIHNSVGTIDERAIQNLSLIVNLSKHLQQNNEKEFEDLLDSFPAFLWVLRDFALKLIDNTGKTLTAKEYLENSLKPQKGFSDNIESKNRIRRVLAQFFKDRDCAMLVRPTESEKDLQNLNSIPPNTLRPEFNDQINILRKKVYSKIKPKIFKGEPVNGRTFLMLGKLLCNLINQDGNNGGILAIDNSWNALCKMECQKLIEELIETYEQIFKNHVQSQNHIVDNQYMKTIHKKCKREIMEQFKNRAIGDHTSNYEKELIIALKDKYKWLIEENQYHTKDKLNENIEKRIYDLKSELNQQKYKNYEELSYAWKSLQETLFNEYDDVFQRGIISEILLDSYESINQLFIKIHFEKSFNNESFNKEKIKSLQESIETIKTRFQQEIMDSMNNFQKIDAERSKLSIRVRDLEEKLNEANKECDTIQKKLEERIQELLSSNMDIDKNYQAKIIQLEENINHLEKINIESNVEFEKIIAIKTQEIEFQEKELLNLRSQIESLKENIENQKNINENLLEKITKMEKFEKFENDIIKNQSEKTTCMIEKSTLTDFQENSDDVILEKTFNTILSTSKPKNDENILDINDDVKIILQENLALKEITNRLEENIKNINNEMKLQQLAFDFNLRTIQKEFEESIKRNEELMNSLEDSIRMYQKTDKTMVETNKNLSIALEKSEAKYLTLEKKIETLKTSSKILKNSSQIICKNCGETYLSKLFSLHLKTCSTEIKEEKSKPNEIFEIPIFTIAINYNYKQNSHEKENNCFNEFIVDMKTSNKHWKMLKSSKYLANYFKEIKDQFIAKNISIPSIFQKLNHNCNHMIENGMILSNTVCLEKDAKIFQEALNTISKIPNIHEISAFRKLIEYPNKESFTVAMQSSHNNHNLKKIHQTSIQRREPLLENVSLCLFILAQDLCFFFVYLPEHISLNSRIEQIEKLMIKKTKLDLIYWKEKGDKVNQKQEII